jgi:hypothetical protein
MKQDRSNITEGEGRDDGHGLLCFNLHPVVGRTASPASGLRRTLLNSTA